MRILIVLACFLLHVVQSQIFENDLPVSLQPPPPPSRFQPKSDFSFVNNGPPLAVASLPHLPPGPPVQVPAPKPITHHAALFNAQEESKLPPALLNPFYKNPRIAEQLAKQSWFEPGENLVEDRDSEKISREKIYYALKSAGLVRRRRYV